MGHDHLPVERIDQRRSHVFRTRSARVAGLAFLETAMHRRLAAREWQEQRDLALGEHADEV